MSESPLALSEVADDDAVEIDSRQFVTFFVGGEMFAVPMAPVQEIIRPPEVVRVPLAPDCLDGLSNLRGRVLPIIGLRHIFGHEPIEQDDATRALVIDLGIPLGFVVDRVSSVISVEPDSIEPVTSIHGSVQSEFLSGVIKLADAQHKAGGMVMIVDFAALIDQEFTAIAAACVSSRAMMASAAATGAVDDEEVESDELQLVSFEVAEQEYAIAIEQVQEIVQVPPTFVKVPNVAAHVLGLMSLRQRLLPLVSLRRMFALPELDATENHRIVVVALPGGQSVGVVMDAVNEVLRVPRAEVESVPALFSRGGDLDEISGICRLDDGRRLVSIISAERMFSHPAVRDALAAADVQSQGEAFMFEDRAAVASDDDVNDDELQVVVFRLGNEEFGVPIDSVQEIVRVPDELTRVPKAPDFVEGVINLRGTVLPVIDQRRRFGLKCAERNDRQRIMVYVLGGMRTGFIVDVVAEVLKIPKAAVSAAPALSDEQARLVKSVANLEKAKRLVMLIEPEQLLEGEEIRGLEQVA